MSRQENGMRPAQKFWFREPIIALLPIISLTFITEITNAVLQVQFLQFGAIRVSQFYGFCQTMIPVPMIVLTAFISELKGRKPVFIALFTLSILTSILVAVPRQETCEIIGFVLEGVVKGGCLSMTYLAISEYCSPKHRFAFLLFNAAVSRISPNLVHMLFNANILDRDTIYIQVFGGVLGAVCLGVVCVWWPESPYWLFGKGRVEEGRQAFLWLRGEDRDELGCLSKERRRPGPRRLFWMSLFIAILTVSMSVMADCQNFVLLHMVGPILEFQIKPLSIGCVFAVTCIIGLVSYKINRKCIFLATCFVSLVFNYVVALCLHLLGTDSLAFKIISSICFVLYTCGPEILCMSLFIEMIPQKYNTHMSCICMVFKQIYFSTFSVVFVLYFDKTPYYFFTLLLTTLSVCVMFTIYFYAPETKGKSLLEIQRSYTPEQSYVSTGQNEFMLQSVQS